MKLYIVVVKHNKGISPEYKLNCEVFLNKKQALKYKKEKENEYPLSWSGDYNTVKIFEKEI